MEIAMRLFPGLSVLTLGVSSVDRATRFYERLGWRRSRASTRAESVFELNNLLLRLAPGDALARDLGARDEGSFAVHGQHYGDAGSVSRAMELAVDAGAQVLSGRLLGKNGFTGAFADPDGHVWELAFDPALTPGPDGSIRLE
jgi:catechol 2,3-dioxygenase-like lactoylglutathione lyase family enzyme